MITALHAELVKLRTTRTPWVMAALSCGLIALISIAQLFPGSETGEDTATAGTQHNIFSAGQLATIFALVLGTLAVTGEYRYGTITGTFLTETRRGRVVAAKAIATACAGLGLAAAGALVALAAGEAGLRLKGETIALPFGEIVSVVAWPVAQAPGYAVLGVAAGFIVRNQVGTLVGLFLWAVVGESLVALVAPGSADYLPLASLGGIGTSDSISTAVAAGVALAWIAGLGAIAARLVAIRDIA